MASNIHKRRKKNKKRRPPKHLDLKKLFSVMLSIFSLIGITGFLLWYFSFDTLDVDDVLALSYSGYNKKGTVSLSFAEDTDMLLFWTMPSYSFFPKTAIWQMAIYWKYDLFTIKTMPRHKAFASKRTPVRLK